MADRFFTRSLLKLSCKVLAGGLGLKPGRLLPAGDLRRAEGIPHDGVLRAQVAGLARRPSHMMAVKP